MKSIKGFISKNKDLIFLFLLGLTPLLWFFGEHNALITGVDADYSYDPIGYFIKRLFAWDSSHNFGVGQSGLSGFVLFYGLDAIFTLITNSVFWTERISTVIWFLLPMLSMYVATKHINVFKNKPYLCLLSAVLFQFNYFQLQGIGGFWRAGFSTYILLPPTFLLLIDYFEGRRDVIKTTAIFGLLLVFLNGGGSPPLFGSTILLFLVVISFYLILSLPNNFPKFLKRAVLLIITLPTVSFILSSFWTLPYLLTVTNTYSDIINSVGGPTATLGWTDVISRNASILNLLRLQGLDIFEIVSRRDYIRFILTNPLMIITSFTIPALLFGSLHFAKDTRERRYVLLLALLTMVGLVFSAGSHEPFRGFHMLILKTVPGFPIFRSAIYKFGGLLWFSVTLLVAFSLSSIIEKCSSWVSKKIHSPIRIQTVLAGLMIFVILLYDYPVFGKKIFDWNPPFVTLIKIPDYIFNFGSWLNKTKDINEERILSLPELNNDWHSDVYRWGYWSLAPVSVFLTQKNSLVNDGELLPDEFFLLNLFYKYLKANDNLWLEFVKLWDIRYFLLKKDFYYDFKSVPTTAPSFYENLLTNNFNISKLKQSGEWILFKISSLNPAKKIFATRQTIYYDAKEEDLPLLLALSSNKFKYDNSNSSFVSVDELHVSKKKENNIIIIPGPALDLLPVEKWNIVLPKPRILPNSLLYFLVLFEEERQKKHLNTDEQRVKYLLNLSLNRFGELNELLNHPMDVKIIKNNLDKYELTLGEILRLITPQTKKERILSTQINNYLRDEKNILASFANKQKDPTIKKYLLDTYQITSDFLKIIEPRETNVPIYSIGKILDRSEDTVTISDRYKWLVPESGRYTVLIRNFSIMMNGNSLILNIDGDNWQMSKTSTDLFKNDLDEWRSIGEVDLSAGEHTLRITSDDIPIYSFKKGDLVLIKKQPAEDQETCQKVTYTKVNPAKYRLSLTTNGQTMLVFKERFSSYWKLYPMLDNASGSSKSFWRFLNENFFNTLSVKELPENQHVKTNGFFNGWNLSFPSQPDKVCTNYDIIIEYWPQKILWLGYTISIFGVLLAISSLLIIRKSRLK